jgi:hypothetical protein
VVPPASRTSGASSSPNDSMPKAISLALTVVIGSPGDVEEVAAEDDGARAGGPLVQEPAVVGVVGKRPRVHGPAAGAQTAVRAGVGPGDEAVEGDRDVSDDSSHARADPIRRPNSSPPQA